MFEVGSPGNAWERATERVNRRQMEPLEEMSDANENSQVDMDGSQGDITNKSQNLD